MPKVTLTYILPEEQNEFNLAHNGWILASNMDDFDNWLRGKIKYQELPEAEYRIYEEVRKKFWEFKNDD